MTIVAAASIVLTPDDVRRLDDAASASAIEGERYPPALEPRTGLWE